MSSVRASLRAHALPLIALLGLLLRGYPWVLPHRLFGIMEVDDGVYYASSTLLLHGLLPYSDFTILHPPVTAVLLLPFATVGELFSDPVGMATARLAIGAVGIVNILLVHRVVRRIPIRNGRSEAAALIAAAVYAVMPDSVVAEHTVLLEPLVNLLCLLAVLLLLRSQYMFGAGVLLTAAIGVKVFAGAYVLGVVLWLLLSKRRALLAPLFAGLVSGALVLLLPFFLIAPHAFVHDLVTTQLSRPTDNTPGGLLFLLEKVLPHLLSVLVLVALLALVLLLARRSERRAPGSSLTLWVLVGGIGGLAFANSPSYFPHYGAFLVPPLAVGLSRFAASASGPRWPAAASTLLLAVVLAAFTASTVVDDLHLTGQRDLRSAGALVPPGSCVFYEGISLAVAADVLTVPTHSCPAWIDGRGVALTWNTHWPHAREFYPFGFQQDARWQRETVEQLTRADFLLLTENPRNTGEWTPATRGYALNHFGPIWTEQQGDVSVQLWKRTSR